MGPKWLLYPTTLIIPISCYSWLHSSLMYHLGVQFGTNKSLMGCLDIIKYK